MKTESLIPISNGQYNLCTYLWLICVPRRLDIVSSRFCRRSAMFFTVLMRLVSGSSPEDTHLYDLLRCLDHIHIQYLQFTIKATHAQTTTVIRTSDIYYFTSTIALDATECLTKENRMMTGHDDSQRGCTFLKPMWTIWRPFNKSAWTHHTQFFQSKKWIHYFTQYWHFSFRLMQKCHVMTPHALSDSSGHSCACESKLCQCFSVRHVGNRCHFSAPLSFPALQQRTAMKACSSHCLITFFTEALGLFSRSAANKHRVGNISELWAVGTH